MKLVLLLVSAGCGYHAQYASPADTGRLHVVLVRTRVADAVAGDEVASGVRSALAREGALAAGSGYPRVEIEVLRADESSEGIAATREPSPAADQQPRARATQVGIVARAWVVRAEGAPRESDTGDVRAFDVVASAPNAPAGTGVGGGAGAGAGTTLVGEAIHHDDAVRAAARRVGERIGMRLLGHPVSRDEATGEVW